jgi:hypothetical protein
MKVGPTLGLGFNIGTGSDLPNSYTGLGFIIGGQVDMNFTPTIGIITNLQFYDNKSGSYDEEGTFNGASYTLENGVSLAYFMIEPLFKLSLPQSNFYFVGGPMVGFSVEGTSETTLSSQNNQLTFQDGSTKQKASLKNLNVRFGLKVGAGFDINVSPLLDITPQFNFEYGLTNVQSDFSSKVLCLQLLTTVKFKVL